MTRAAWHRWRGLAAGLALLGLVFHATVLPWHGASRFAITLAEAALAADLVPICHRDAGLPYDGSGDQLPAPADPRSECPICKGLSAHHFAVLPTILLCPLGQEPERFAGITGEGIPTGIRLLAPKSRGPPLPV